MEQDNNPINAILNKLENLSKTTYELWQLKAIQKSIVIGSAILSKTLTILFLFIGLLFLSIGTAIYIGSLLPALYYGFALVALFYFIIFIVLIVFASGIKKHLTNLITKAIFN
jgi:hypothetical protein